MLVKHFVIFSSPGTFFSEQSEKPIDKWDVNLAMNMAKDIKERYGSSPYGFNFITRGRHDHELDSKIIDRSVMYYLGGKIETMEEIEARNDPSEEILRSNIRRNGYKRVLVNTNSYKITLPLKDDDIVLQWN